MRLYRNVNDLLPRNENLKNISYSNEYTESKKLEDMTKEELIREIVKAKIAEARLKKGYEVKGDGSVILYGSKNIR